MNNHHDTSANLPGSSPERGADGAMDGMDGMFLLDPAVMTDAEAPVLVMDRRGLPVFANKNAHAFAEGIRDGIFPEINRLVERAITTPGGVVELLTFEVQRGTATLELTALPISHERILLLPRDVSMDRNLRDALIDSRQRYRDIVEVSSAFAWETDDSGQFVFVSPRGALGYRAEDLVGRAPRQFLIEPDDPDNEAVFRTAKSLRDAQVWLRRANGSPACLSVSSTPVYARDGRWIGTRGLAHDITEQRRRETEIATARNRDRLMTYIVRTMRDEIDPTLVLKGAAEASARALACTGCAIFRHFGDGSHDAELVTCHGSPLDDISAIARQATRQLDSHNDQFEANIEQYRVLALSTHYHQRTNGAVVFIFETDHPEPHDGERAIMAEVSDQIGIAIEQATQHDRIVTLSRTDGMTGLLNRRAFFEELGRRHARLVHDKNPAALMYVDMDNFKLVNDVHGHQTGDEAILTLTSILVENTRPSDLVARLGGDEFVIWLDGADTETARQRARVLLEKSTRLTKLSGAPDRPLGISVGIAVHDAGSKETLDQLVQRADQTMYQVKKRGKGSFGLAPSPGSTDPARIEG